MRLFCSCNFTFQIRVCVSSSLSPLKFNHNSTMPNPLFKIAANVEEKRICCCGAGVWTKVIAWLEIIGFGLGVLFVGPMLAVMIFANRIFYPEVAEGFKTLANESDEPFTSWTWIFVRIGAYFIVSAFGFIGGITLLVGAKKIKPKLLHHWLIHTYVMLAIELPAAIVEFCFAHEGELAIRGIGLLVLALHQSFFIWVVRTHKKEMENKYERMREETVDASIGL